MCGICGLVNFDGAPVDPSRVASMTQALIHRGPDDAGTYFNSESPNGPKIGLGFRRLSIIDLAGGHQPMRYKRAAIVFNGEIYNYRELKKQCESSGHKFQTQSDTEVILHLYDQFKEGCLEKLNGMFAFAVWDDEKKEIFLARDRLGIKPLYYFHEDKKFVQSAKMAKKALKLRPRTASPGRS